MSPAWPSPDTRKVNKVLKMLPITGPVLLAALALSMIFAGSAFAEEALKWLFDGGSTLTKEKSAIEGNLKFINTKAPIVGEYSVECKMSFDGTIGAGATEGEITEVLNASGVKISPTTLTGTSLSCTNLKNCESPKVWILGLPYKSTLELSAGRPVDQIVKSGGGTLGFYAECTDLGIKASEECTGEFFGEPVLENIAGGDVLATFDGGKGNCSGNKEATGQIQGTASIFLVSGLELTISGDGIID
jgi:hypothetical protein